MDPSAFARILTALEARGVDYAVVGAIAMGLHGLVRGTQDLDMFVAPDAGNIARLKQALHDVFDDPNIDDIVADDLLGDYPAVAYYVPDGSFHIDILTRLGEAFAFHELETQRVPFGELTISVVTPRMLYEMKRDTVRPKDKIDAAWLRDHFKLEHD